MVLNVKTLAHGPTYATDKNMQFLKQYRVAIIGALLGAAVGYLYWKFFGSVGGATPIESSSGISAFYGSVAGVFSAGILEGFVKDYRNKN